MPFRKIQPRRESGEAFVGLGHVTIPGVADHQWRRGALETIGDHQQLKHKSHGLRADPGKVLAHGARRRKPTKKIL